MEDILVEREMKHKLMRKVSKSIDRMPKAVICGSDEDVVMKDESHSKSKQSKFAKN